MSDATAETATETTETATEEAQASTETQPQEAATDLAAELERWKAQSRKNEDRAKANAEAAKELERLKREALPEQERLVEEARAAARAEALAEVGEERVESAVRVAAAGRQIDVDAVLEGLDRKRFLSDDGKPDTAAIKAWVERIAPITETATAVDLGQGARQGSDLALNGDPLLADLKNKLGIA